MKKFSFYESPLIHLFNQRVTSIQNDRSWNRMEEQRLIHHRACRVTSCGRELATYRARRESGMGGKQREALGLIPEFAAGTGPRRVKEQFGQKARVRFVSVSTSRVVLYTVSGASAPCTPAVLLATLAGALSGLGESSTRTRAAWNPDVLTLQRHRGLASQAQHIAVCLPAYIRQCFHIMPPPPLLLLPANVYGVPAPLSPFLLLPLAPLRGFQRGVPPFDVRQFRGEQARTGIGLERVSREREASLPSDENGLKSSVKWLGFRLPGRELERNHEKGHSTLGSSTFLERSPRSLSSFLPSNVSLVLPPPRFFSAPNFRANSPDEFHSFAWRTSHLEVYGSMILLVLIRVEVIDL